MHVARREAHGWGPDRRTAAVTVLAVATTWVALKLVALWGWVILPDDYGDTYYYFLTAQEQRGAASFPEYPTPAGLILTLPYRLGIHDYEAYRLTVVVATTVVDGAFAVLLGRRTGPVGVLGWMVLTTVLGQVSLLRFDMLPAVAAAAAILLVVQGSGRVAAVLIAVGTALKLWPVILAPLVVLGDRRRLRTLVWFAGSGLVLAVWSIAVGGWARLLSPLTYQSERGLQIESVAATIPMRAWVADTSYSVWYSTFHAYEIVGPGVTSLLDLLGPLSVGAFLGWGVLVARWFVKGAPGAVLPYLGLTGIGAFMVTSPALSPQYLLWIAAPTAVLLGLASNARTGPSLAPAAITWVGAVTLCLLTTAVYPVTYEGLLGVTGLTHWAIVLLTARNVALIVFLAWTAALSWSSSGSGTSSPTSAH